MTKSSMPRPALLPLAALAAPAALAAQSPTPEEAIEAQRAEIAEVVRQVCPTGTNPHDPDNVVVCGRRPREGGPGDYRVPPSVRAPGEVASGSGLEAMSAGGCLRLCPQPVVLPLLTIRFGGPGGRSRTAVDEIRDALGGPPN